MISIEKRKMLSLRSVIQDWGFTSHPFEAYTAENEPRLSEYFVPPPYLDDMIGSAATMTPAIVFGSRGIGKSAIRIHIENACSLESSENSVGGKALAITYDDFSKATDGGVENASLEKHLEAIIIKAVTAALTVMANKMQDLEIINEETIMKVFPRLDFQRLGMLVNKHFTPLSELQKEKSLRGIYDYFHKESLSLSDRVNWFQKLWVNIRVPLLDIANIIQAARGGDQIQATSATGNTETGTRDAEGLSNDLHVISAIAEQLGYDGWYILIDKVDEDEHTDSDVAKSARLILPLLKSLRILEIQKIGFKFFLWDKLRPILVEERVRLDKVRNWEMSWTEDELKMMIDRRLSIYSDGRINSLLNLVDDSAEDIYQKVIY